MTSVNNETEATHSDAGQNDSAAKIKTNITALRISIDLPSCIKTPRFAVLQHEILCESDYSNSKVTDITVYAVT
jgi:hypothetical protein